MSKFLDDDDAPELTNEMAQKLKPMDENHPVMKALKRGRPKAKNPKASISLRLDPDILERYRATGNGWQTRMRTILEKNAP